MAAGSREGLGCFGHPTKDTDPKCQEAEQEIEPQNALQGRLRAEAGAGTRVKLSFTHQLRLLGSK